MQDKISEHIESSIEGLKQVCDMNSIIGQPINTASGVTVIPISKLTAGMASGGVDYDKHKKIGEKTLGTGGGTGISITPVAFLAVSPNADIKLIPVNENSGVERIASIIENAPAILGKIKDTLS